MAEILGAHTILDLIGGPTGVDFTKVAEWMKRQGASWEQITSDAALAIAGVNQEIVDKYGFLMSTTEEYDFEYPNGGTVTASKEVTDVTVTDGVKSDTIGHMIELKVYESALSASMRSIQDLRRQKITATINTMVAQVRERFEYELFWRLFRNDEKQIGTSGYNVGFVTLSGSVVYTPLKYGGATFSSHTHYNGYNSGASATLATMLDDLSSELAEHGHNPTFTAYVSRADINTYRGLAKFVDFVAPSVTAIDRGGATTGASYYTTGQIQYADGVFGYYQADAGFVELRATARVATGYAAMFKSYGQLAPRNPLRVRVRPGKGFGAYLVTEASARSDYPIEKLLAQMEFGVGVGEDRTNGAVGYLVSGGTFANPTIS